MILVTDWGNILAVAAHVIIVFVAGVYISLHRRPTTAIAWIVTIIFLPLVGLIAFLLVGSGRLPHRRIEKQREVNAVMLERAAVTERTVTPTTPTWLKSAVVLNQNLGSLPMVRGNCAQLLEDYEGSFDSMIADIDAAKDFIHVQFYILIRDHTTGPFFEALARARARGVTVRVLSDYLANRLIPQHKETADALADIEAEHHVLLPWSPWKGNWQRIDLRNHRKLLVIDGETGYMGSQNLIDSTYLKKKNLRRNLRWKELMVRLEGPVVEELNAVFIADWFGETDELLPMKADHSHSFSDPKIVEDTISNVDGQVVPSGPTFENDNNLKLFVYLIQNAHHQISIASPYFVPDESTMLALVTAAARGVKVELFVSEVGDQAFVYHAQRSYYTELLKAGVEIYLYHSPTVLHSKHFSIDDEVVVIGSSNMDIRSFRLNMEISLLLRSRELVEQIRIVEDHYRSNSVPLDLARWRDRPLRGKVFDGIARLTSDLQ